MATEAVKLYLDEAGEWRWSRFAANGRIIAASTEGYHNRLDARENAEHVNGPVGETHNGTVLTYVVDVGTDNPGDKGGRVIEHPEPRVSE